MVPSAFSDLVVTFRGRFEGNSRILLVSSRLYFRAARLYLDVQISWEVRHFVDLMAHDMIFISAGVTTFYPRADLVCCHRVSVCARLHADSQTSCAGCAPHEV